MKQLAGDCDLMLVVGSPNSSNSNRLRELAERMGTPAYLIDEASQINAAWLEGKTSIGVTAGASAPEVLVNEVITRLRELGGSVPEEIAGREENIVFSMPRELRIDAIELRARGAGRAALRWLRTVVPSSGCLSHRWAP